MKQFYHFSLISVIFALLTRLIVPVIAQDTVLGPGEGAAIIEPNFGGDITTLNPLLASDGASLIVIARIMPSFLLANPQTQAIEPNVPGSLVTEWNISSDGKVYTFRLRNDWKWSDGTPITSADIKYAYDAIASNKVDFPYTSSLVSITALEAPDPQTVVITYKEATCTAINAAGVIPVVPAHVFTKLFGTDYAKINDSEYNLNPTVTAGAFSFKNFRPGEQVTVVANQTYPDTGSVGHVIPEGYILKNYENQTVITDAFLKGEVTLLTSVPEDRQDELKAMSDRGEIQWHEGPSSGWQFIAFNVADTENPQNGLDDKGSPLDQGHHPIFGDLRVRQALMLGKDYDSLNERAFHGHGLPVASPTLSYSWAYNKELEPWPYDAEKAMQLLEEAGWKDTNGDGIRECQGCLYGKAGDKLSFNLLSFTGNTSVDNTVVVLKDQWAKIGVEVVPDITEFQTMLEKMDTQKFDAVMLFLGGFDPNNPDELRDLFTPGGDILGSGFNWGSYSHPKLTDLFEKARTLPGCDQTTRKQLYDEAQQILHDDVPLFWVNTAIVPSVAQKDLLNWKPLPGSMRYNLYEWQMPRQ